MNTCFKFGLSKNQIEQINQVFVGFKNIEKVVIYGSRATGRYRSSSDIDLCIIGAKVRESDLLKVQVKLEELPLPWKYDLNIFHTLDNKELKKDIETQGMIFYKKR